MFQAPEKKSREEERKLFQVFHKCSFQNQLKRKSAETCKLQMSEVQLAPEQALLFFGHHEQQGIGCFSLPCEHTVKMYGRLQCFQSNVMDFNGFFYRQQ